MERPILFSGPMVSAILAGRKTQTRRVIKPQPQPNGGAGLHPVAPYACPDGRWNWVLAATGMGGDPFWGPYLEGDALWVRETWRVAQWGGVIYRADKYKSLGMDEYSDRHTWRPSIFLRRADSRLTLRVTAVRIERVQDISCADAIAEGCTAASLHNLDCASPDPRDEYRDLWDSINGKRAPWSSNPWVWVVTFQRVPQKEG